VNPVGPRGWRISNILVGSGQEPPLGGGAVQKESENKKGHVDGKQSRSQPENNVKGGRLGWERRISLRNEQPLKKGPGRQCWGI